MEVYKKKLFVITDEGELYSLLSFSDKQEQLLLKLSNLSPEENEAWQEKLNKEYFTSGNAISLGFFFSSILLTLGFTFPSWSTFMASPWNSIGCSLGFVLFMTAIGKVVGLAIAKLKLRNLILELSSLSSERPLNFIGHQSETASY